MTFIAAFSTGSCGTCNWPVRAGQEVEYDGTRQLVHVICPALNRPTGKICPDCFMELPVSGECGTC